MKKAALIAGILGAVIIGSSITITQQNEYKLIRQFGKVDRVICEPGISFKNSIDRKNTVFTKGNVFI